jgi:exonuclease VII small subunit
MQTSLEELNLEQALTLHYDQAKLLQQTQTNIVLLEQRINQLRMPEPDPVDKTASDSNTEKSKKSAS